MMFSVSKDTEADISIHNLSEAELQSWAKKFDATIERIDSVSLVNIYIGKVNIKLFT